MKSYFAYLRVSTVRQGEHGSSLQEQKSAIEAYATRNGLTISQWFEERVTAAKSGRPEFSRMIVALRKAGIAGVIIHKIDRSARNLRDWARLGELVDQGVELHFAHETLDLTSRGGRLAADIQAVVAADFIRNLRQETRKGLDGRLKQGIYPFRAPLGYVDCGGGKPKEPHPVFAPLIRDAFEMYATGQTNLDELRREMHRRGLTGHSGRGLSRNGMATILHNPFYIGVIRIKRTGQSYAGRHQPIVTKATFERVQQVLSGRFYRRAVKHRFAFSRLLRCAACGFSLIGELQKGHIYYRCHTASCRGTALSERTVDALLGDKFARLTFSETELGDLRDFGDDELDSQEEIDRAQRAAAQLALGKCDDRMTRLTDAYLDHLLDRQTFDERKEALLIERRGYAELIETPRDIAFEDSVLSDLELGNRAQLRLRSASADERREIVMELTSNLSVSGKNLVPTLRFPFDVIAEWRLHRECDLHRAVPRKTASQFSTACTCDLSEGGCRFCSRAEADLSTRTLFDTIMEQRPEPPA